MKALLLLVLLVASNPAHAYKPVDPARWTKVTGAELYFPAQNPAGGTGAELTGSGHLGDSDILHWSWNIAGYGLRECAPNKWHAVDVTRTWWGSSSGIPDDATMVMLHAANIMTAGALAPIPAMQTQWRAYGSASLNPIMCPSPVVGARLSDVVVVPVVQGKVEFLWLQSPFPSPPYGAGGSTYSQHGIVMMWAR